MSKTAGARFLGYMRSQPWERLLRDARIAMIYEGANGIQALDLVGRKLGRDGGRAVSAFFKEVTEFVKANSDDAMKQRSISFVPS